MSGPYTGVDTNFPTSITIPSDGDDVDAAAVNPAFEGLADAVAFLKKHLGLKSATFTASGSFVAPAGCTMGLAVGYGAGGGGGGGQTGAALTGYYQLGGGGGGGARMSIQLLTFTPGSTYAVAIGAGGAGGATNTPGSNGGDTTCVHDGGTATFPGGGKGWSDSQGNTNVKSAMWGGGPVAGTLQTRTTGLPRAELFVTNEVSVDIPEGHGGFGGTLAAASNLAFAGAGSATGKAGGPGGTAGAVSGAYNYGTGGGGGGGGPGGTGGAGGNGGNANNAGAGAAGTNGTAAAANTGAGGGGGGAGGSGTSGGAGGTGGAGGSGKLTIYYLGFA